MHHLPKLGLTCKGLRVGKKGRVNNSVIIDVITVINYMQLFKYKYNVKICLFTISAMYQITILNVSIYIVVTDT